MSTKINSYILPDKVVRKMKDTIKASDKSNKNICFALLKTENGELSDQELPVNISPIGPHLYCKPHTGQVILDKRYLKNRDIINIYDVVGYFTAQANEKEPSPDLTGVYTMCENQTKIHCLGANNKINCYKRKPDSTLDCEEVRIKSESDERANVMTKEESKKLYEKERPEVNKYIKEHFDKIDII